MLTTKGVRAQPARPSNGAHFGATIIARREHDLPGPVGAAGLWLVYVVCLSAVAAAGPAGIAYFQHRGVDYAFGEGELLAVAFAIFAAATSKWLTRRREDTMQLLLRGCSIIGLALTAILITAVWLDNKSSLGFSTDLIVKGSVAVIVLSLAFGLATEIAYAVEAR